MKNLLKMNKFFVRVRINKKQVAKKDKLQKKEAELDDKFIKLSKQELESKEKEIQQKLIEQKQKKILYKNNDISLEKRIHTHTLLAYQKELFKNPVDLTKDPLKTFELLDQKILECQDLTIEKIKQREQEEREKFSKLSIFDLDGLKDREVRKYKGTMNPERYINEQYTIKKNENATLSSRRVGALGYKLGMTHIYDKWGFHIPLTAIKIDRNQIIGQKIEDVNGYNSLIVGAGEKSLRRLKKSKIGIFLKARVPPKVDVKEFRITEDNFLPIGYMIGVRHFTVGQYVDIQARTKGKGTMGVMKAFGFKGQPQTHGTHGTHRSPGSIGARQDPGKVWKRKKMPGRHGYKPRIHRKQLIYKIDFPRSIIYLKGSVPGATGRLIKITDAHYHRQFNEGLINYPTFVYEKDKIYPDYIQIQPPIQDPAELWEHENEVLDFKETDLDEIEDELF